MREEKTRESGQDADEGKYIKKRRKIVHDEACTTKTVKIDFGWSVFINRRSERDLLRFKTKLKKRYASFSTSMPNFGSVVWTDYWICFNSLSTNRFIHQTVNHSENFVERNAGVSTPGVESA